MDNYIIFNKLFFNKLNYKKLESKSLHYSILECYCKNFNLIYCIMEEETFKFYGSKYKEDILNYTKIENKKNFSVFLDISNVNIFLQKIYDNMKIENFFLFHSKLNILDESYRDIYQKLIRNFTKNNNIFMYVSKIDEINIQFTNYIFDVIFISKNKFQTTFENIQTLKLNISKIMIFNMNYFIFLDIEKTLELFMNDHENIYISNNNKKYKNFMIVDFKNLKKLKSLKETCLSFINITKIHT